MELMAKPAGYEPTPEEAASLAEWAAKGEAEMAAKKTAKAAAKAAAAAKEAAEFEAEIAELEAEMGPAEYDGEGIHGNGPYLA